MEDDRLLDASEDDILVPDTQDSPATFSQNLIKRFGICRNSRSTDAAHTINNNDAMDEAAGPSTLGVASSLEQANRALEEHLIDPLR